MIQLELETPLGKANEYSDSYQENVLLHSLINGINFNHSKKRN